MSPGKFTFTLKTWIIIGVILLCVIGLIAYAASSSSTARKTNTGLPSTVLITIKAEVGVEYIKLTNQNMGQSIILTIADLPYNFNCTQGDSLRFEVYTLPDYAFNAWRFNTAQYGSFDDHNPFHLQVDLPVIMTANVLYIEPTPAPSPTPSPSETT